MHANWYVRESAICSASQTMDTPALIDVVRTVLDLPADWQAHAIVTLGAPASKGKPYARRPLADVVRYLEEK